MRIEMSRNKNKYAGLAASQQNDLYRMTPKQWKTYLHCLDLRTMRKLHRQMERRGGPEWDRVKDLFIEALFQKQKTFYQVKRMTNA